MRHAPFQASQDKLARYWRSARRLTLVLLLVWLLLTLVIIFFARELSGLNFFGWPFSFYMAAQGATLIYVAIVAYYAWAMQGLDQRLKDDDALADAGDDGKVGNVDESEAAKGGNADQAGKDISHEN